MHTWFRKIVQMNVNTPYIIEMKLHELHAKTKNCINYI